MLEHLRRLFTHLRWADSRVLARLREGADDESLRLFAHVLAAEKVWLTRLEGRDSSHLEVWPTLDLNGCAAWAQEAHVWIERYLDRLAEEDLPEPIEYRNQHGRHFRTSRVDVLTHLAAHGSYHRGQIARALRLAGKEPVNTDFITWAREQG